jgi:hypothetical protein
VKVWGNHQKCNEVRGREGMGREGKGKERKGREVNCGWDVNGA